MCLNRPSRKSFGLWTSSIADFFVGAARSYRCGYRFVAPEGLGISTKVSWLPRTGPVASPPLGELGRIEGVITTSDATPAAAVFDVVLTDVDGTELIRLPIALWTDGTE